MQMVLPSSNELLTVDNIHGWSEEYDKFVAIYNKASLEADREQTS